VARTAPFVGGNSQGVDLLFHHHVMRDMASSTGTGRRCLRPFVVVVANLARNGIATLITRRVMFQVGKD
jgi:hypothetical protein